MNEIEKYKEYKKEYGNDLLLSTHLIIEYGNKAYLLYTKNNNILNETYVEFNSFFEQIKYLKERGLEIYEQDENYSNNFGSECIKFIGEWNYITNKLMYFIFKKIIKIKNI